MILLIIAILLLLFLYFVVLKPLTQILLLKLKFGDRVKIWYYPISGFFHHVKDSLKKHNDFLEKRRQVIRQNPKVQFIVTNVLSQLHITLVDPQYIKQAYLEHHQFKKLNVLRYENLVEKGLVGSEDNQWKYQRTLLSSSFTFEKLKKRIPMINQVAKKFIQSDPKDNLSTFLNSITGEVVIKSFFGSLAEGLTLNNKPAQLEIVDLFSDFVKLQLGNPIILLKQLIFGFNAWKIFTGKKENQLIQRANNLRDTIKNLINSKIIEMQNKTINQDDMNFLEVQVAEYLKQNSTTNSSINIEIIIQQFITLFFAGTDTTATTCGTCLYFLAKYPEIQEELYEEIIQIIGKNNDVTEVNINQLQKMLAFIQEVLRVKNPAFNSLPRIVKEDTQIMDLKLKKNWILLIGHDLNGQQEHYVDNSQKFDYKRWLNQEKVIKNDTGFIHIPFAAGPRNCIGQHMALMETKIILCQILQHYIVSLNPKVKQIRFTLKFLNCIENDDCILFTYR